MGIIDSLVTLPNPHPIVVTCPSTPKMLQIKKRTPTPSFVVFTFRFAFESFKECGGASHTNMNQLEFIYLLKNHAQFMF